MKASLFAIALAAAVLAGCGGSGGGRLSHSEFVKRADALCKTAVTQVKAVPKPQSLSELPRYLDRIRPIQARFLAAARKLRAPVQDEPVWQRAIDFDQRVLQQYKQLAAAARRRDVRSAKRISNALAALPERNPYERRLGMKGC